MSGAGDWPPPFDAAGDLRDAPRVGSALRPRDAATLILTRGSVDGVQVLMGRRAPGHVFMASKWVFPGGRVERADVHAASASELKAGNLARLACEVSERRGRALALTAVRETFEETGLMLARPAPPAPVAGIWAEFRAMGALPDLAALSYIARAVTPPGRSRRFDARFFMADATALLHPEPSTGSGELDEIAWLGMDAARSHDLAAITRFILDEVAARLVTPDRPLPFVRVVRGQHRIDYRP